MDEALRNDVSNLLATDLKPRFLSDFNQLLNLNYHTCIENIKDTFYMESNFHAAQKMFSYAQLYLAEIALHKAAIKHNLMPVLLPNVQKSDQYLILSSQYFNVLLVRGEALNKYRGRYKGEWASLNEILENKQLSLEYDNEVEHKAIESMKGRITVVIEVSYTMSDITENQDSLVEPTASFSFSIPNSNNTGSLTSFSYKEIMHTSQQLDEPSLSNETTSKHSLINIKKRLDRVINE